MENGYTIDKLIKDFIYYEEYGQSKSQNTIKSLRNDITQFLEYYGSSKVDKVDDLTLREYVLKLQREKIQKRSINRKLSSLRTFFKYLKDHDIIKRDPSLVLTGLTFSFKKPDILSVEELNKIRTVINNKNKWSSKRDLLIVELLYSSGVRASELLGLSERLFSLEEREVLIASPKGSRKVFFSNRALLAFKEYIKVKKAKFKENYNEDILFVNGSGTRLSDRSLRRIIGRYGDEANLEKEITPHTFRHSFGHYMVSHGMPLLSLKELMGHSSIESTRVYEDLCGNPLVLNRR